MGATTFGGDEFDLLNQLFGFRTIEQKRIVKEGFVREASAAGFLPGEVLIEKCDLKTGGREPFTAQGAGWASTHYGNSPNGPSSNSLPLRVGARMGAGGIG